MFHSEYKYLSFTIVTVSIANSPPGNQHHNHQYHHPVTMTIRMTTNQQPTNQHIRHQPAANPTMTSHPPPSTISAALTSLPCGSALGRPMRLATASTAATKPPKASRLRGLNRQNWNSDFLLVVFDDDQWLMMIYDWFMIDDWWSLMMIFDDYWCSWRLDTYL